MTRLHMAGFESGHPDVFTTQNGLSASTTWKRTGAYSLRFDSATDYGDWVLAGNPVEIYGRVGLLFPSGTLPSNTRLWWLLDSDGAIQLSFRLNVVTMVLEVYKAAILLGSTPALNFDTWYCVEFRALIDDVNGVLQVKVDGIQYINFAGDTQDQVDAEVGAVRYGHLQPSYYPPSMYMDDLAINDTAGGVNDTWIGRGGIYMVKPQDATGTYDEFTPTPAVDNYANVDEIPPDDDVSYVESNVVDIRDAYTMTNLVPVAGTISAVKWLCRAKLAAAGIGGVKYLMVQAGVDYTGADKVLDASYRNVEEILDVSPSTAAWTVAIVNAIEAGQKVV